ncbi:MAG: TipAS antibiotic-recognition domain-containing protein [Clostridia bacterium]|nr:TipAS antibiotic-recognition domain-containing protein [Clostridia bacterium]
MKNYETEARERWGESGAYRECEERTKSYTKKKWAEANDGMMAIFAACATCKANGASPTCAEAQALVQKLKSHITEYYYTCTDEILAGLGRMYVSDERFRKNIDKYGEGTAEWISQAILQYCKSR